MKPEKSSGLYEIQTHDLCNNGAVLYQLSQQANWELVIFATAEVVSYIHKRWLITSEIYYEPFGSLAQLVEHCTDIAEVVGPNPGILNFFRPHFHYCLSSVRYCEDRSQTRSLTAAQCMTFVYSQNINLVENVCRKEAMKFKQLN